MEKLTIKELAPYLPYKLQWKFEGSDEVHEVMGIDITDFGIHLFSPYGDYGKCRINEGKPLLRPLSSLTEEIDHNGERFIPINNLKHLYGWDYLWYEVLGEITNFNVNKLKYACLKLLLEWHFDVFGLIERGLALPIDGKEVK